MLRNPGVADSQTSAAAATAVQYDDSSSVVVFVSLLAVKLNPRSR
jgi:hypothetical protein